MNIIKNQAIKLATQHAQLLSMSIDDVAGITLGGSLSKGDAIDRFSDIDMFVYLNRATLPNITTMSQLLGIDKKDIRRRTYLLEYRLQLEGCDTNIKFFTLGYLESNVHAVPTLDPQYLEELDSYANQIVLVDRLNISELLTRARTRISESTSALASHAIERYGKAVSWAIFQWRNRGYATVAMHSIFVAFDSLLCAYYLGEGQFPPSLKWRASERALIQLRDGVRAFQLVLVWTKHVGMGNIEASLGTLRELESLISNNFTMAPWSMHAERWWLGNDTSYRG